MGDFIQEYEGIYYAVNRKHIKIVPIDNVLYAFEEDIGEEWFRTYTKEDIIKMMHVLIKMLYYRKH